MTSEPVINPVWEIFEPELIDNSVVEKEWVEYREINVTNVSGLTKYEIETRDKDSFILPHEGYLEVRYYVSQNAAGGQANNIPVTDVVGLQNNSLSLFKNIEYLIEDQRIEYCDDPAVGHTIKNLADFSKQHGESIASNQQFYLDTKESPSTIFENVRFFINTAPRVGLEIMFNVNAANSLVPTSIASDTTWQNGDAVVASVNDIPIIFRTGAGLQVRTLIMNAGLLSLTINGASAANDPVSAYVTGFPNRVVQFMANGVAVAPLQNGGNAAIVPIDGAGNNGDRFYANVIMDMESSYNVGFSKRQKAAASSNLITAWIPFKNMFLFARAYDKISRGLRHRLVLNKQVDSQMLFRSGGVDRFVVVDYISAWIPRLKPSLETLKMLETKLISNDLYTVNFTDLTVWRTNNLLVGNASNNAIQLTTTTKKPIRVWVAFQKAERIGNTQTMNKRVFDHLNTTAIQVRLNGKIFPLYEYKFIDNFINYNRAYTAFLNAGFKMNDYSDGSLIDMNTYKSLYPIFFFDLTAQEDDLYKANKYAELEVRWSNQATDVAGNGYHMWVVYEAERAIKFKGVAGSLALEL